MSSLCTLRRFVAAFLASSFISAGVFAQVDWLQQSPAQSPSPRGAPAMTYDAAHQKIVLFGGFLAAGYSSETWTYDGTTWTLESPASSPPARAAATMAYDAPTQRVILFGGYTGSQYLGDTWVWDGANWTPGPSGAAPTPVTGPMSFPDPVTQRVLLYGGYDGHFYQLTMYQWTAGGWSQLNPTTVPYARAAAFVAPDPPHAQVVLFGGLANVNPDNTWTWNGTDWTEVFPNSQPPLVYDSAGAFDPAIGHPILFGGGSGGQPQQDTWEWTGTDWMQLLPQMPPAPRESVGLAYDAALGHIVLFGGADNFQEYNDTWWLDVPVGCCLPYCAGDGSGTACPCGNPSPGGTPAGCLNSLGMGGKILSSGQASLANDTLVLRGSDMPSSSALYFQGTARVNGGAGLVFGDGLRCAGGVIVRLGLKTNVAGASQYPSAGDPSVSVRGQVTLPGIRDYQVWYRNAAPFCTPSTFNLTNGLEVTWGT
jgi:hypothetical protein